MGCKNILRRNVSPWRSVSLTNINMKMWCEVWSHHRENEFSPEVRRVQKEFTIQLCLVQPSSLSSRLTHPQTCMNACTESLFLGFQISQGTVSQRFIISNIEMKTSLSGNIVFFLTNRFRRIEFWDLGVVTLLSNLCNLQMKKLRPREAQSATGGHTVLS